MAVERVGEGARAEHASILREIHAPGHRGLLIRAEALSADSCRVQIAYKRRTTARFFSSLSDLYHYYDMYSCVTGGHHARAHVCV